MTRFSLDCPETCPSSSGGAKEEKFINLETTSKKPAQQCNAVAEKPAAKDKSCDQDLLKKQALDRQFQVQKLEALRREQEAASRKPVQFKDQARKEWSPVKIEREFSENYSKKLQFRPFLQPTKWATGKR